MSSMEVPSSYQFIIDRATKEMPRPLRVALAGADTENILRGMIAAYEDGFVEPILIGDEEKIKAMLESIGHADLAAKIMPCDGSPVQFAIEMIRAGAADCLMRGNTQTRDVLLPILNKANHLVQEGRLVTDIVTFTVPGQERLMAVGDVQLLIVPSQEQKEEVVRNIVEELSYFGIKHPNIALLAMVEKPAYNIRNSVEAATMVLNHYKDEEPIADCELVGPITYDLIMSKEAARIKHYDCPYCGEFDGIVVPHLLAGNAIVKVLEAHTDTVSCSILVGTKVPVAITGRSDKPITSYLSLAACCSQWLRLNRKFKRDKKNNE